MENGKAVFCGGRRTFSTHGCRDDPLFKCVFVAVFAGSVGASKCKDDPKNTCAVHSDHIGFSGDIRDFEDGRQGIDGAASESDRSVVHPDTARISALRVPAHGDNGADDWIVRGLLYTCGFLFPELPKQKVAGFRYKSKYIKESRRQSCLYCRRVLTWNLWENFRGDERCIDGDAQTAA